jgi:serine/threonine protein phosphatase PrpC
MGLSRSSSTPVRGSNDNLVIINGLDEQSNIEFMANSKKKDYDNITNTHDSGYSFNKRMIILDTNCAKSKKEVNYTEDRHINFAFGNNNRYHVIGAADGHGGSTQMAVLASGSFPIYLTNNFKKHNNMELALLDTFSNINKLAKEKGGKSGTTLNICVIDKIINKAYIANLGDSVTQIFRKNEENNIVSVFRTIDHDAYNENEQKRLKDLFGPAVRFEQAYYLGKRGTLYARIYSHEIMVVGGIGDFQFPEGFIRRVPDIYTFDLQQNDIIITSSDGFYETYNISDNLIGPGRPNENIVNSLTELENENKLYDSQTLAQDLLEFHLNETVDIYHSTRPPTTSRHSSYDTIKYNRDNNSLVTYIHK